MPWSLLRATQFHALVAGVFAAAAPLPACCRRCGIPLQPIDTAVVARRLAELVHAEPAGRVADVAGPQVETLDELADAVARTRAAPAAAAAAPADALGRGGRGDGGGRLTDPAAAIRRADVRAVAGATMRSPTVARAALWITAASAAGVGAVAAFAPRTFYDDFPYVGHWVDRLPPYNEHLVTDVGALYLGFALVLAWAAATLRASSCSPHAGAGSSSASCTSSSTPATSTASAPATRCRSSSRSPP